MHKYYIAYGSNMNINQMKYRCPRAKLVSTEVLCGYKLTFRRNGGGYANIEKSKSKKDFVPVAVWKITDVCEKALDRYEGFPSFYLKKDIKIEVKGKKEEAMVYVMNKAFEGETFLPRRDYFEGIRYAYEELGIDTNPLVKALRDTFIGFYYI